MRRAIATALVAALALAALALPAAGSPGARGAATRSVKIGDNYFVRKGGAKITVSRGTTVRWRFRGHKKHNVLASGPRTFHSPTKRSGSFSKRLKKAGTYRIVCTLHSRMKMRIKVKR